MEISDAASRLPGSYLMTDIKKVLILDNVPSFGGSFSDMLAEDGYEIYHPEDAGTAIDLIRNNEISALITDSRICCNNGVGLHEYIAEHHPEIPVILLNALHMDKAELSKVTMHAFCYFNRLPDYYCLRGVLARAIEQNTLKKEVALLKNRLESENISSRIIGSSREMSRIFEVIKAVRDSGSSVLISGEAGTGKELIARTIGRCDEKKGGPFVAFNCSAMPKELIEAELFGWDRGVFPRDWMKIAGKFEEAANGTLFLEDIGDLELSLQAKLLGVIRERDHQGAPGTGTDFRLISSTRRDLKKEVKNGNFREDLFYRINQVEIPVPSLRERKDDIPLLFSAFIGEFCAREKKVLTVSEKVMKALEEYPWPGNVRQLRNIAEKAVVLATGEKITLRELPGEILSLKKSLINTSSLKTLRELEKDALKNALQACRGNKSMACRILGISRKAMYRLLRECQP
jgi:DNA-binding NtrC family response regulator